MYEEIKYSDILSRMLDKVSDDFDKREGSVIMNALAPAAMEIFLCYMELEKIIAESYADTQSRSFLLKRAAERGIEPISATPSVWKGNFDGNVNLGDRFSVDEHSFVISENVGGGEYKLVCEQDGSSSNVVAETLLPLQYNKGLTVAELTELLVAGGDEEETEAFRARYFTHLKSQAFGGNVADYREKALIMDGVGDVKIIPCHAGVGTVKIIIMGVDSKVPSENLVADVQNEFDPISGEGMGLAPIGHTCTVEAVKTLLTNISFNVSLTENSALNEEEISSAIGEYLDEINGTWGESDNVVLRVSRIESKLLELPYVTDIWNTEINGENRILTLPFDTIAVKGDINAQVV